MIAKAKVAIERDEECSVMHSQQAELVRAYDYCEQVTRQHSKSFYLATTFLPPAKRRALRVFYAFCRTTDDIVDLPDRAVYTLTEWRRLAQRPARSQHDPVLQAWCDVRERYQVPHGYGEELIDGCAMDLTVHRYETSGELRRYCYHVASTVGLVSMHIIGSVDGSPFAAETVSHAIDLGVALQLTNFLRDVGEDLERGRIYLPLAEMAAFDYGECDLLARKNDERFQGLMQFQIERADQLYADHLQGLVKLKADGRMAVAAAILLYRGILGRIVENKYDVFTQRARLSSMEKVLRLPAIYRQVRSLTRATENQRLNHAVDDSPQLQA